MKLREFVQNFQASPSYKITGLIIVVLSVFSAFKHQLFTENCHVIQWDGYGYYAYLPGMFLDPDPGAYQFIEDHFDQYSISEENYQVRPLENGRYYPIYNIGLSLLWLPFFLIAHAFSLLSTFPPDGMSAPYQWAVVLTSILFIILGWLHLRKLLLLLGKEKHVVWVLLALALGTNYFYYGTVQIELTHHYLFSIYAIFLYHLKCFFDTEKRIHFFVAALCSGVLVLIRSSEIFVLFIPFLYGMNRRNIFNRVLLSLKFFTVVLAFFSLQILYYYFTTGHLFINGYGDHSFDFMNPHLWEGWFSYRRGWLVYSPILILALLGFFSLYRSKSPWLLPLLTFSIFNHYLLFSWDVWWYGNTFGSRPLVQSYALMSIPMLAFLERNHKNLRSIGSIISLFIALNLFQTWQFERRIIPLDMVNKTYYWDAFLRTTLDRKRYIYLDTNQKLHKKIQSASTVFEREDVVVCPGAEGKGYQEFYGLIEQHTPSSLRPSDWVAMNVHWEYFGDQHNKWSAPKLVTELRDDQEQIIFWKGIRLPYLMDEGHQDSITYHLHLDTDQEWKSMKVYLWNQSTDSVVVNKIKIDQLSF